MHRVGKPWKKKTATPVFPKFLRRIVFFLILLAVSEVEEDENLRLVNYSADIKDSLDLCAFIFAKFNIFLAKWRMLRNVGLSKDEYPLLFGMSSDQGHSDHTKVIDSSKHEKSVRSEENLYIQIQNTMNLSREISSLVSENITTLKRQDEKTIVQVSAKMLKFDLLLRVVSGTSGKVYTKVWKNCSMQFDDERKQRDIVPKCSNVVEFGNQDFEPEKKKINEEIDEQKRVLVEEVENFQNGAENNFNNRMFTNNVSTMKYWESFEGSLRKLDEAGAVTEDSICRFGAQNNRTECKVHGRKQTFQPDCLQECVDGNNNEKKSEGSSSNSNPQQSAQISSGGNSASGGCSSQGSYGTGDGDGDPEKNRRNQKIVSGCANDNGISDRENQDGNNRNSDENRENSDENKGSTILECNQRGNASIETAGYSGHTHENGGNRENRPSDVVRNNSRRNTSITNPTQQEEIQQAFSAPRDMNKGDQTKSTQNPVPNHREHEDVNISVGPELPSGASSSQGTQGTSGNENHRRTIPRKRGIPEPESTDTGQEVRKRACLDPERYPENHPDLVAPFPRTGPVDRRHDDEDLVNNVRNRSRPGPERCLNNRRDIVQHLLRSIDIRHDDEDPTNNIAYEPQRPDRTFYHPPEILREGSDIATNPRTSHQQPLQNSRVESYGNFEDFPLTEQQRAAAQRRRQVCYLDDYAGNLIAYDQPRPGRTFNHPASPREGRPWICDTCRAHTHPLAPQFCPVCGVFLCEEHIGQRHRCIHDRVFENLPSNDGQDAMEDGGEENAEMEEHGEDGD
uniref:uncharacterized protein LOC120334293 isoform X2 n=1 Tax=Styela clava TaxID=7725 RepID=UPI00193AB8A1|nr:uncharacterized protein LOC120334293 isoform X2 [Styela clava]